MVMFSICVQASEGASYGVVPFLTRRALGVASGYIGAGGNAGATINMALWFKDPNIETYDGIMYMGYLIICVTLLVIPIHFPMWGSMFLPGDPSVTEEDYYIKKEFSEEEIKEGLAVPVQKFCDNCRNERAPRAPPRGGGIQGVSLLSERRERPDATYLVVSRGRLSYL
jgi:NNP family nitrate/nitrite transporter-like MFS transporter